MKELSPGTLLLSHNKHADCCDLRKRSRLLWRRPLKEKLSWGPDAVNVRQAFTTPPPRPHQSLGDVPSCGQRLEMSAVVNQLHLLQVQGLQNLLAGSVHHLQLLMAVHQDQRAAVNPLRTKKSTIFSLCSTALHVWLQCVNWTIGHSCEW